MMRLNLLGNETKKQIKQKTIALELINGAIFLALAIVIATTAMIAAEKCLAHRLNIIGEKESSAEEIRVENINGKMRQLTQVQDGYVKWSTVLKTVIALVPEGVKLNSLALDKNSGRLRLAGQANDRADYLNLENKLGDSILVEKVNAPVSNLLHQNDVAFTLEAFLRLAQ
ncbi:hypothetical protein A3H03_01985 [Candidatus Kuenenbacteria bacterium RIFCSPLOWO2_12_FULL_42_13]|uniref:Uncharacterized protein n=3 Tax=Candidatus Kueneniibacteriota TaxID=1752740 RepID=A0A1F6G0U6_9BACT|nr:MAG: hypothetical protein A3H55_00885 [Candidatus Kuenenbacteria bacterium RIFCSPLOWO2_02_FULL_42_16]OGG91743.1 MAG: hypothetical protein A3H03_01985 [Candidatus Kuenenbacteria bacterium RIFCSPLOWO2_12_FULL_42_13]